MDDEQPESSHNNGVISKLPPEIWLKIIKQLDPMKVVQLRQVSKNFKNIVDEHYTFKVKGQGNYTHTIPGPHVKIHDLQLTNYYRPITKCPEIMNRMGKLKVFHGRGPTHSSVINHILLHAQNLERLRLDSYCFAVKNLASQEPLSPPSTIEGIASIRHLHKLTALSLYQPNYLPFALGGNNAPNIDSIKDGFVQAVQNLLRTPILLPLLTRVNFAFQELELCSIYKLCDEAIIPFIQLHWKTLEILQVHFTMVEHTDFYTSRKHFTIPTQPIGTKSMIKLQKLYLDLPDAAVNGFLKALWADKHVAENTLTQLLITWKSPLLESEPNEKDALQVLQNLLQHNAGSLQEIKLKGINTREFVLFDFFQDDGNFVYHHPPQTYPFVEHMKIVARNNDEHRNNPHCHVNIQRKLVQQCFPNVLDISLCNLGIKMRSLQNWLVPFQKLELLKVAEMTYENDEAIDLEFLESMISKQPVLREVLIYLYDLLSDWNDPYWNDVRELPIHIFPIHAYDFLVIRP